MGALGRVELPTNGLGNKGFHPSLNWLSNLRTGRHSKAEEITSFGSYLATHLATR